MQQKGVRSYIHVTIQFAAIIYIIISGSKIAAQFWIIPETVGVMLGLWSVWVMRKSELSVFPEPEPEINLIQKGPYKIIRHPMYLALFLVLIPLLISDYTYIRLAVMLLFTANQIIKMLFEEKMLVETVPGYKEYRRKTKRLIPFIY